jgi:adenylate cyclase
MPGSGLFRRRRQQREGSPGRQVSAWLEPLSSLLRAAAGAADFLDQAARVLVELVDLDRGLVLLWDGTAWEVAGRYLRHKSIGPEFDPAVLQRVAAERRAVCRSGSCPSAEPADAGIRLAAPVFTARGQLAGALFGGRAPAEESVGRRIGPPQLALVQLLASAVGAGLARQERETEAAQLRRQCERFLSTELAGELRRNPRLLEGQEREVTVLFCDICGFTRLAERLGPRRSCRLVVDVMECATARVRETAGSVVDYYGDGLLAMWNAPADQPDHAVRACQAALAIQADLPRLSAAWQEAVGGPLGLGIAVNTGPALVGNTGSRYKVKYGPIGHTVNLAQRVEGAIKHLGVLILITGSTRARVGDAFATRRLCRVRVPGIHSPVDLYELHAESAAPDWFERRDAYEAALAFFEAGQWGATCRTVYPLLAGQEGRYDLACLHLVARAVECLKAPPASFDPVQELGGK